MTTFRLLVLVSSLFSLGSLTQTFAQCVVPGGLNVTNVAFPSATLQWNAAGGANSYTIKVENGSGKNTPFNLTLSSPTLSVTVNNFPVPGNYKFKVRSKCGGNHSNWSGNFNFTVGSGGGGGGGSCGTPTGLNVTNVAVPNATLGWNAVGGATSYSIQLEKVSGIPFKVTLTSTTTSVTVNNLPSAGNYKFKVRAVCNGNNGSWSPYFFFPASATGSNAPSFLVGNPGAGSGFTMFPNPVAGDLVTLKLDNFEGQQIQVRALDLLAREVHLANLGEWSGGDYELNVSDLQAGMYLVEVVAGGQRFTQKLIVRRQ